MATKNEYERYSYALIFVGIMVLLTNFYHYLHPLLKPLGLTGMLVDSLVAMLVDGGVFSSPLETKLVTALLISLALLARSGKPREAGVFVIIGVGAVGAVLYLFPYKSPFSYLVTTVTGLLMFSWAVGQVNRKGCPSADGEATFEQCRKLIRTPDSINIPMRFMHEGRMNRGWINVVNPFRATMILGNPGSGKSFSVYEPFIEQMIEKGYCLFVYDYKYPSLSQKVYNELLSGGGYDRTPEFHVIDMNCPTHSNRCNPLHPRYIRDPADASEIAELIMLNVKKTESEKEDFFTQSAKVILEAVIWFLRVYEDGRFCTFPHVIEFMTQDYKKIISILLRYPETQARMKPFANALQGNAQDQLQGQLASAQIPLLKFVSKSLYWTLTGDDFSLELNDPEHPKVLCVGNDPDRQMIYGTTIALITSRMFKTINRPGRLKCGVLLDEFPTVYLKGIDNLIATARSNRVAVVIGAQDKSQIRRDYGDKESEVIFNTVGNLIAGQVIGNTADAFSKTFGKEPRNRDSYTSSQDSESVSTSIHDTEMMPVRRIETLSQGVFIGRVADKKSNTIERKLFCGEIIRKSRMLERKKRKWKPMPRMTDFGEEAIASRMRGDAENVVVRHVIREWKSSGLIYSPDLMKEHAEEVYANMSRKERKAVLEEEIKRAQGAAVERRIQENFLQVQQDVLGIIEHECGVSQKVNVRAQDPRVTDPFDGIQ